MSTPHDRLFRYVFSDPEHARGLLAALVPEALGARIDWPSLELVPGSFVAPELSERETDALFRVELEGRAALLYVLVEHQSQPDALMPLRMLGYVVRVMERHLRGELAERARARPRSGRPRAPDAARHPCLEGRREAILQVLDARGRRVSDVQRERVLGCADLELLARWLERAAVVESAEAVFAEPGEHAAPRS